jgi:uncharacterized protein YfaS (alpha-2-macroglobulin family)
MYQYLVRNRWFILAALFLVVNAAGLFRLLQIYSLKQPDKSISVVFSPGNNAVISSNASLAWSFSTDIVPAETAGEWTGTGPVQFHPETHGRFCWLTPRKLVFEPGIPWRYCSEFIARFDDEFCDKHSIEPGVRSYAFHTPHLLLRRIGQTGVNANREATLQLVFNSPPLRTRLNEFITVTSSNKAVQTVVLGETSARHVYLKTAPIMHDDYTVTVRKGLPARDGPLGLLTGTSFTSRITSRIVLRKLKPVFVSFDEGAIDAQFSTPLDFSSFKKHLNISPDVDVSIERRSNWNTSGFRIKGQFKPGKNYSVTLAKGLKAENGSVLNSNIVRQVYFKDRPPDIKFKSTGNYLSKQGAMLVPLSSVNVPEFTVSCERIYPNNLVYFAMRQNNYYGYYRSRSHLGISHVTTSHTYNVSYMPNCSTQTYIHMPGLMGGYSAGGFMLTARSKKGGTARCLVIITDIGISVRRSGKDLLVWANSIHALRPVTNALVTVYSSKNQELYSGTTDTNGLVAFSGDMDTDETRPFLVTVQNGDDISYLSLGRNSVNRNGSISGRPYLDKGYEAFVYSDRGIYRPGEKAHFRAVVREKGITCPDPFPVQAIVTGPDRRTYRELNGMLSQFGTVEFSVSWERYIPTGRYTLELRLPGSKKVLGTTSISVEEFVPPQIAVKILSDTSRTNASFDFHVSGRYLFGRPAEGLKVNARALYSLTDFTHSDWKGYQFGNNRRSLYLQPKKLGEYKLDKDGKCRFTAPVSTNWLPPAAIQAGISATVMEPSGRAVSAYESRIVDVYPYYLGLRADNDKQFKTIGKPVSYSLAAVLPDGKLLNNNVPVILTLSEVSWSTVLKRNSDGSYRYESEEQVTKREEYFILLTNGIGVCTVTPSFSGSYLVSLKASNSIVSASTTFYAGSEDSHWHAWSREKPGQIELKLDKDRYIPGDKAELLINAPFTGKALLTLESDRVLEYHVLTLDKNTCTYTIPVNKEYAPNIYCSVCVLRPVLPEKVRRPHRATGIIPLMVHVPQQKLDVSLSAPEVIRPASQLDLHVSVSDTGSNHPPVELVVAAVDEGICMLTGFSTPDPLKFFESRRRLGVGMFDLYGALMPEIDAAMLDKRSDPGGDKPTGFVGQLRHRLNPVNARRFKPVALWSGTVETAEDGTAIIPLDIPEFSGKLRLMAVATGINELGSAESHVTAKRPIVVKHSLPRFLAPDDTCIMPVTAFNETGSNQEIRITITTGGSVTSLFSSLETMIGPGMQFATNIPVSATALLGVGTVTIFVSTDDSRYSDTIEIPVRPPSARDTIADFGSLPGGSSIVVRLPSKWMKATATNSIWCSGLPSIRLNGSLDYLLRYPYGCLEQTTSASFPLLYLADLAAITRPGSMGTSEPAEYVQAGIFRLLSMQQYNGCFSYWPRSMQRYDWGSVYAIHFLLEASKAGYTVPSEQLNAAYTWLERILNEPVKERNEVTESDWNAYMCNRSYACYVLARAGRVPHSWLTRLREQVQSLDIPTKLNLAGALAAAGMHREAGTLLDSIGLQNAAAAKRRTSGNLNSGTRAIAMLLSVWLDVDPHAEIVPLLVKHLESVRRNGCWYNTQENAMALMALGKYARVVLKNQQPFTASVTINGTFKGTAVHSQVWYYAEDGVTGSECVISNAGPGTLYYFWSSRGIPLDGTIAEQDLQLKVRRSWLNLEGHEINPATIRQGDLVVVKLTLDTSNVRRKNLVVEDLLPAGLEVENPNLRTSQLTSWMPKKQSYTLQNLDIRDDRVILFINSVNGTARYYYAVRAVTPGEYVYPPVSAECMYDPLVRSVNGKRKITIKE